MPKHRDNKERELAEDNAVHPRLAEFRQQLRNAGFNKSIVCKYCCGVKKHIEKGLPLNYDLAQEYFHKCKKNGDYVNKSHKTGVYTFIKFLDGVKVTKREDCIRVKGVPAYSRSANICDEDCFNCKYSDCVRPDYLCTSVYYEQIVGRDTFEYEPDILQDII